MGDFLFVYLYSQLRLCFYFFIKNNTEIYVSSWSSMAFLRRFRFRSSPSNHWMFFPGVFSLLLKGVLITLQGRVSMDVRNVRGNLYYFFDFVFIYDRFWSTWEFRMECCALFDLMPCSHLHNCLWWWSWKGTVFFLRKSGKCMMHLFVKETGIFRFRNTSLKCLNGQLKDGDLVIWLKIPQTI